MFLGRTHHETFVCNTELQTKVSSCVPGVSIFIYLTFYPQELWNFIPVAKLRFYQKVLKGYVRYHYSNMPEVLKHVRIGHRNLDKLGYDAFGILDHVRLKRVCWTMETA